MICTIKELLKVAEDEIGYIGKKNSTDNTDVKEAPNGAGKFNKYSRELLKESYYNTPKDGADYCCIFVDWCFYKACGSKEDAIKVKPLAGGGCGAGVYYSRMALKDQMVSTPQAGDIFFHKDDSHTGIVKEVKDGTFTTVEGNWGSMVTSRKNLKVSDFLFARPNYAPEPEPEPTPEPEEPTEEKWHTILELGRFKLLWREN